MFFKRYSCKTEVFGEVMDGLNVQFLSNIRIGLVNKRIMGIALIENYEVCNLKLRPVDTFTDYEAAGIFIEGVGDLLESKNCHSQNVALLIVILAQAA